MAYSEIANGRQLCSFSGVFLHFLFLNHDFSVIQTIMIRAYGVMQYVKIRERGRTTKIERDLMTS